MLTLRSPKNGQEATGEVLLSTMRGARTALIGRPAPPPPRWAQRAATLAVVTTLPSGLWRMAMAVGVAVGASEQIRQERYGFPGWGTVYVFG